MVVATSTRLIAHQGGWDEILMFLIPIGLAFLVIRGLERKGRAAAGTDPQDDPESQNTVP